MKSGCQCLAYINVCRPELCTPLVCAPLRLNTMQCLRLELEHCAARLTSCVLPCVPSLIRLTGPPVRFVVIGQAANLSECSTLLTLVRVIKSSCIAVESITTQRHRVDICDRHGFAGAVRMLLSDRDQAPRKLGAKLARSISHTFCSTPGLVPALK